MKRDLLQFGYVSRAHGLKGEVVVRTFDPTSTVIDEVDRLVVRLKDGTDRELEISNVREGPGGDLLVSFDGIRTREAADELRASGVFVLRDDLEEPEEGEFFQGDLVGLEAVTAEGKRLGTVEEIWSSGPVPNLVIRDGREELMVPFAEEFVTKVDLDAGQVVIVPPVFTE